MFPRFSVTIAALMLAASVSVAGASDIVVGHVSSSSEWGSGAQSPWLGNINGNAQTLSNAVISADVTGPWAIPFEGFFAYGDWATKPHAAGNVYVPLDTVLYDTAGTFTTNDYRYRFPSTGLWEVAGNVQNYPTVSTAQSRQSEVQIEKIGSTSTVNIAAFNGLITVSGIMQQQPKTTISVTDTNWKMVVVSYMSVTGHLRGAADRGCYATARKLQ